MTVNVGLIAESASIQGTVRDAVTGLPIPAALVQVFTIGTTIPIASVQTDQQGRYVISGLLPEEYRVVYSAPTYQSENTYGIGDRHGLDTAIGCEYHGHDQFRYRNHRSDDSNGQ